VIRPGKSGRDTKGMASVWGMRGADSPKGTFVGTTTFLGLEVLEASRDSFSCAVFQKLRAAIEDRSNEDREDEGTTSPRLTATRNMVKMVEG